MYIYIYIYIYVYICRDLLFEWIIVAYDNLFFFLLELLHVREWKDMITLLCNFSHPYDRGLMWEYHRVLIKHAGIIIQNTYRYTT